MDVSDIFTFFPARGGGRGSPKRRGGGSVGFYWDPRRGGEARKGRGAGRWRAQARADSHRQRQDSPRIVEGSMSARQTRATSSAAASGSAVLTPTPTRVEESGPSNTRPPITTTSGTIFSVCGELANFFGGEG